MKTEKEREVSNTFFHNFISECCVSFFIINMTYFFLKFNSMCDQLSSQLNDTTDLYRAIHKLLELLRQDNSSEHPDGEINPNALHYFSSTLGISFVAACLRQQCQNR